ncbi:MAG: hypothetical protein N3B11_07450, partial [Coriobacteriia bacterium]|nr:hypothetical protein [Coriobacteriia bacterium]
MNSRRAWTTAVLLGFVVGGIVLSAGESPEPNWFGVLLFGLLAILLDLLAFQLPGGGSISMAFVMPFTALLLY